MLEVRRSNIQAQRLYQSLGFVMTGVRKGYYSDDGEDAFAMTLELSPQL
jgi:[ribosomal protein S18]-alanine N-acetyltransferase